MKTLIAAVSCAVIIAGTGVIGVSADDTSEQVRALDTFTSIRNKGSFEVFVTVGEKQSVKVTADSEIIDKVETDVRGETLHIELEDNKNWLGYRNIDVLRVDITVETLEAVRVDGSGNYEVRGLNGGNFSADVNGSGDIDLIDAKTDRLSIAIKGSGDVDASGECTELDVEIKGSGGVSGRSMSCKSGDISIMGSGDVDITLNESVDVGVMGSGDVTVWGKPEKVKSRSMGSGDIVLR